ncbi:uncharacterized protein LOC128883205 isoform X1 [Hylaeus volcanicus]|uniref:uncharacterized protein LOC128883205 isoform X1 n=1 Tax=Hylaeus volcanicus TaxID=313075 RepID=UPI0023B858E0|nr:uncharacterized protein LOC128883205 isoform X1 [Hylaeus volcanicus]
MLTRLKYCDTETSEMRLSSLKCWYVHCIEIRMRLKVEAFYEQKIFKKSVVLIPPFIQTIRKLQEYLIAHLYNTVSLSSEIFLTLDNFSLDINNPITILSHDDVIRIDVNAKYEYTRVKETNGVHASTLFSSSKNCFVDENSETNNKNGGNLLTVSGTTASLVPGHTISTNATMEPFTHSISTPSKVVPINTTFKYGGKAKMKKKCFAHLPIGRTLKSSTFKPDTVKVLRKPRQGFMTRKKKVSRKKKIHVFSTTRQESEKKKAVFEKGHLACLSSFTCSSTHDNDFVESTCLNSPCTSHLATKFNRSEMFKDNVPHSDQVTGNTHFCDRTCHIQIYANERMHCENAKKNPGKVSTQSITQNGKKIDQSNRYRNSVGTRSTNGNVQTNVIETSSTCHDSSSSEASRRNDSGRLSQSSSGSTRGSNTSSDSTRGSSSSSNTSRSSGSSSSNSSSPITRRRRRDESLIGESNQRQGPTKTENTDVKDQPRHCSRHDTVHTTHDKWVTNKPTLKMVKIGRRSDSHFNISVGDQISYNVVSLNEGCPEMSDTLSGEVVEITTDPNLDEKDAYVYLKSLHAPIEKVSRYSFFNLMNIRQLKAQESIKVTEWNSGENTCEDNFSKSSNVSACASYTQHHAVLGDVEIPCSFTNDQINHLIETKISAVRSALRRQIDFYFSDKNYWHDKFLQSRKDKEDWIPLVLVASFNRIRRLTTNLEFIKSCVKDLLHVEISNCQTKLRRKDVNGKMTKRERYNPHRIKATA